MQRDIFHLRCISIHALRGEGDLRRIPHSPSACYFNPRPPWGGRRRSVRMCYAFLYISIHALRGEGDNNTNRKHNNTAISIHALRGEGDKDACRI